MEINQLRYFYEVAQRENITQAANQLHITQPALSKTIARLEDDLGVQLFDRIGKTVRLNSYGISVLKHTEQIFFEIEDMRLNIADLKGGEAGRVRVGCSLPTRDPDWIADSINTYTIQHPKVSIAVFQMKPSQLREEIERLEIDIAVGGPELISPDIKWTHIYTERLGVIMSKNHPLAMKKVISMSDLANEKFLCNNSNSDVQVLTNNLCLKAGFTPTVYFESYFPKLIGKMVYLGRGVSIIAENQFYEQSTHNSEEWERDITFCQLSEDYCVRDCGIAISQNRYLSKAAQDLYDGILDRSTHNNN